MGWKKWCVWGGGAGNLEKKEMGKGGGGVLTYP